MRQPLAEITVEEVFFGVFCRLDQVVPAEWGKGIILVIGESDPGPERLARCRSQPVQVGHRAAVPGRVERVSPVPDEIEVS